MLILITCTYKRPNRFNLIKSLSDIIGSTVNVLWIIVEDNKSIDQELKNILPGNSIYLAYGPTKDNGNAQRNIALEYIKLNRIKGIIYNLDDDNKIDEKIFDELRKVKNVAFLPVGNLGPNGIERPIVQNGKFIKWDANWNYRKYPVDMAGFAFNSNILNKIESPVWPHKGKAGETEFLEKILKDINDAEFLCNDCKDVYVWHNGNV